MGFDSWENTDHRINSQYRRKRGIILPICFVGATTGSALGWILGQDPSLFAALGLTGLLAGAINTPITAVILGLELFGLSSGPYLLLSCTIAFVLSGHRSAIPTQLLQFTKAPALQASLNKEIGELERTQTETEKNMREETNKTRKG